MFLIFILRRTRDVILPIGGAMTSQKYTYIKKEFVPWLNLYARGSETYNLNVFVQLWSVEFGISGYPAKFDPEMIR